MGFPKAQIVLEAQTQLLKVVRGVTAILSKAVVDDARFCGVRDIQIMKIASLNYEGSYLDTIK